MDHEARGTLWSDEEIRCLIAIWGEANIQQQLDGAVKKFQEKRKSKDNRDWDKKKKKR